MYTCLGLKKKAKNLLAQMPHKKKKKETLFLLLTDGLYTSPAQWGVLKITTSL